MYILNRPDPGGPLAMVTIGITVEDAIFPFKPGSIQAYTGSDDEFFFGGTKIEIEVENLRWCDFRMSIDERKFIEMDPRDIMAEFYDKLFRHYRYRPSLPVEDHIILGEE